MPARDRLKELQANYEDQDENRKSKEEKIDKEIKIFLKECDVIRENFNKINENIDKIKKFLEENRVYKFEDLQNGVRPISKETDKIIQKVNQKLKQLHIDKEDVERVPSANNKMKFMQYTSLREGFKGILDSYVQVMKLFESTLEKFKIGIQKTVLGEEYDETEPLTGEQNQLFIDDYFAEKQIVEQQLRDVEERHGLLVQIEQQLTEIKDLFVQIAILVDQQQESINRAEYHAAISSRAIEMATNDLESAKKKKKKVRKMKIILIVVGVVILIILIAILIKG